jgi:hypothetical protein
MRGIASEAYYCGARQLFKFNKNSSIYWMSFVLLTIPKNTFLFVEKKPILKIVKPFAHKHRLILMNGEGN